MNESQSEEVNNPNYLHVVGDNDEIVRYGAIMSKDPVEWNL